VSRQYIPTNGKGSLFLRNCEKYLFHADEKRELFLRCSTVEPLFTTRKTGFMFQGVKESLQDKREIFPLK